MLQPSRIPGTPGVLLSNRERTVLQLVSHGLANADVGRELGVTVHAVKFHLASIYKELGVTNRTEVAGHFFEDPNRARPVAPTGLG